VGSATFQGSAYNVACSSVTSSTVANWVADPATANLSYGNVASVPMNFRSNSPVTVKANFSASVAEVYTSIYASYARMSDGTVMQWGATGAATGSTTPVAVPSLTNVATIAGGVEFACAAKNDGTLWCWGLNAAGALGPNVALNASVTTPVQIPFPAGNLMTDIAAGMSHVCAVSSMGNLYCWGYNLDGELGIGTLVSTSTPVLVRNSISAVAAGSSHTCVLDSYGSVLCAGKNDFGQLGNGTQVNSTSFVYAWTEGALEVAAGQTHTCLVAMDRTVRCFGWNAFGNLGDGTTVLRPSPVAVLGLGTVVHLALGAYHTCALLQGGTVSCWGSHQVIGTGQVSDQSLPVQVPGLNSVIALHSNQGYHTCVDLSSDWVYCWGLNPDGEVGNGTVDFTPAPTPVLF
jgi:alpha-tubulin suppressor-like RCC1 family protein